jgi:hypothetical protein
MSGLRSYIRFCVAAFACAVACAVPAAAVADPSTGGASPTDPEFQPHGKATLLSNGLAIAPADAPPEVKSIIEAQREVLEPRLRLLGLGQLRPPRRRAARVAARLVELHDVGRRG